MWLWFQSHCEPCLEAHLGGDGAGPTQEPEPRRPSSQVMLIMQPAGDAFLSQELRLVAIKKLEETPDYWSFPMLEQLAGIIT